MFTEVYNSWKLMLSKTSDWQNIVLSLPIVCWCWYGNLSIRSITIPRAVEHQNSTRRSEQTARHERTSIIICPSRHNESTINDNDDKTIFHRSTWNLTRWLYVLRMTSQLIHDVTNDSWDATIMVCARESDILLFRYRFYSKPFSCEVRIYIS